MANIPVRDWPACVLLSGGLDSVAALHWALHKYSEVRALLIDYGQPHRDRELPIAWSVCERRNVPRATVVLADALRPSKPIGLLDQVVDHEERPGPSAAFLPGRNLVFLSIASVHACAWWPEAPRVDIVIGACREDAGGFPDCTEAFLSAAEKVLTIGCNRTVHVAAPWVRMPKAGILEALRTGEAREDVARSWSCYRGQATPCGACTACVLRQRAFAAAELEDRCSAPTLTGGDVHRARTLNEPHPLDPGGRVYEEVARVSKAMAEEER